MSRGLVRGLCGSWAGLGVGLASLGLLLAVAGPAPAATIDIETSVIDDEPVSFITIEGEIEFGDEARFADLAIGLPHGIVLLNSPGGNVHAGIEIGKAIRLKGFGTAVAGGHHCASACALAWLGGIQRMMSSDSAVGFHAVYLDSDPDRLADSVGNALVGAYLNSIGLAPQAIAYITEAQPREMRWLSFEDARAVGIEVISLDPPEALAEPGSTLPGGRIDDWASSGEWIQIYSRQSLAEAIDMASTYRREFPDIFVFRYDNGWYVGAIGPYPFGKARAEKDRLVRARRIPSDSLVHRGERFEKLVWGTAPERPAVATRSSVEALALVAAEEFFTATSKSRVETMAYLNAVYARQVEYFGKLTPKAEVLQEKAEFVARWPQRRYKLRAGAQVECRPDGRCVVDGLVEWSNHSTPRKATSTGTARYTLTFVLRGGSVTLLAETSTVLERDVRQR